MDFEAYWAKRPAQLRNTAKRKAKAAGLDIEIHDRFDEAAWADYEAVYRASWKPEEGSFPFLRALAEQEGAAGTLRLGIARKDGRPVAAQLWLVENGEATIHKLAYAEDAKALSPGTILGMAMFRRALDVDRVAPDRLWHRRRAPTRRDWMAEQRTLWRLSRLQSAHGARARRRRAGAGFGACRPSAKPLGARGATGESRAWSPPRRRRGSRRDPARRAGRRARPRPRTGSPASTRAPPLFGALPEFDSMAVAGLLTELEERLGILIEDHEVDADMMETFGVAAHLRPDQDASVSQGGLAYERYRSDGREEWLMRIGAGDAPPILFVPPLFEEMNRTRALIAASMRRLAAQGLGCWLPDLTGTGESDARLSDVALGRLAS